MNDLDTICGKDMGLIAILTLLIFVMVILTLVICFAVLLAMVMILSLMSCSGECDPGSLPKAD